MYKSNITDMNILGCSPKLFFKSIKYKYYVSVRTIFSELFNVNKSTISRHLKNIFDEKELEESSVVANFETTASDCKKYTKVYMMQLSLPVSC